MAKDDYYTIVYKVLVYLYACLKRKITFDEKVFSKATGKDSVDEEYFYYVLRKMSEDGLIENIGFTRAWGDDYILFTNLEDCMITPKGIEYLTENNKMKAFTDHFLHAAEFLTGLVKLVF